MVNEVFEGPFGLTRCDRPGEVVESPRMIPEFLGHQCQNFLSGRVGGEPFRWRNGRGPFASERLAIVGVKIPFSPYGFLSILHQNGVVLAEFAIEMFKAKLFAPVSPRFKEVWRGDEVAVIPDLQVDGGIVTDIDDHLLDPPFPGLNADDFLWGGLFEVTFEQVLEPDRRGGGFELFVEDMDPLCP